MDDSDNLCPLCCEELDLSDREFYPCKCGYQVCMWCWHRIREIESGLCPACRTPYGSDPHQFSAVDVEEVLKANKEKEAAAKRDRQRQQYQLHNNQVQSQQNNNDDHSDITIEAPKDRTQLGNMRVIRRNLVYAVGLPPNMASEDVLRKPEYFGQYGKISKIVLNRTQASGSDPRRASASAYVTFVHKEDTLSCILALDGYHLDGRNIRASYGTSKYCSAFIKNVRCNNPECTYLHEMGAAEDTFTKQEIQAGYVTSGRDVLARQQQIVAEQLRQTGAGSGPRKRIGSGGPSGTGKSASNPVFPPPEFDEPSKPNPTLVPQPAGVVRSSTATAPSNPPISARAPATRSGSLGSRSPANVPSNGSTIPAVAVPTVPPASAPTLAARKPVSAASVVAGVHSVNPRPEPPEPHTTLTPLTPLKRTSKSSQKLAGSTGEVNEKLTPGRTSAKKKNGMLTQVVTPPAPQVNGSTVSVGSGPSSIGGEPIGPPPTRKSAISALGDPLGPDLSSLSKRVPVDSAAGPSSLLGGEVFTGQLPSKSNSAIGAGKDKWTGGTPAGPIGAPSRPTVNVGTTLWGDVPSNGPSLAPGPGMGSVGGSVIGSRVPGPGPSTNSSSALASLLGINLPTGSGSLQETNLWPSSSVPIPVSPSPLASLNTGAVPAIGGAPVISGGSSLIGGIPIGTAPAPNGAFSQPGPIGGGNTKSDIALLQSLLPGVHITSGSDAGGFGGLSGWQGRDPAVGIGPSRVEGDAIGNNWGTIIGPPEGSAVGAIGRSSVQQKQRGIW